ncbi:sodium:solute symporter [Cytobacillus oceanisediminis]|uniref:sodium:solute symporter family protein n=1 Tax=Cytobacillus TaxID=2675230 RepID=UPI00203AF68A|nr:sodium:solute symporter family protein [Cytobacillus oceanisediminis]MCM3243144.1 sodium:solute symporter family protein [Cytobacillus oceanisediminis]MCM3401095.1 sodium:solute symporter family protein [Cytobacillus oceanisediminis]MDK7665387.1 sodium:solute symporter family protein [Cytobacillus oceanisediminis]
MNIYLVAVVIYLVFMALIGVYFAKKSVKNSDDFMVAGRSLPLFVVMGTLLATFVGSGTVVGGASFIYQYGPFAAIFNLSGGIVGAIILYFIASKIRKIEIYTVPELLERRFGKTALYISSVIIIFAFVGITAYQFTGGAYVLQLTTGIPLEVGAIIMCALVIFLTVSGGLFSVAYSDALSAVLIIIGFLFGVPFALNAVGGFEGLALSLPETNKTWNGGLSFPQLLGFFLPLFLLVLGDQNMYQRFSAAKDPDVARKSTIGFFVGNIFVISLTIILATTSIVLFPEIKPDTAILSLAIDGVPLVVGLLILCSAVAFIITTATSYLLSASGNIVSDLIQRSSKSKLSESKLLWYNRVIVVILGVLAYVLGQFFPSVLAIQMYSYTMYGASLTPAILATVLWKNATKAGVISSMIVGGSATMIWEIGLDRPLDWNSVLFALPLSVLTLIIVSLATRNKSVTTDLTTDHTS